jgi:hypothetical protein
MNMIFLCPVSRKRWLSNAVLLLVSRDFQTGSRWPWRSWSTTSIFRHGIMIKAISGVLMKSSGILRVPNVGRMLPICVYGLLSWEIVTQPPVCMLQFLSLCYTATNIYIRFQLTMLSSMPFKRLPQPTWTFIEVRGDGRFNWARNDNIDSLLAYMCGKALPKRKRCERCQSGNGIMQECVLVKGYMKGACSNCWKNSKQASCIYCEYFFFTHFVTPN